MSKISKKAYIRAMRALHKNHIEHEELVGGLHPGQADAVQMFLSDEVFTMFVACGRKWGKSHFACYIMWRHALMNPGSSIIYVAPTRTDAFNILWENNRVQKFLGADATSFMSGPPNNKDLRITLKNGSYIKLMGSERYASADGLSPNLIIYDEFKNFHPELHRTMSPNRAAKGAKLVIIGTKADHLCRNKDQYNTMLKIAEKDDSQGYIGFTTFDNPLNHRKQIKETIEQDIKALRAQGLEDVVQREYYNKIIAGGSSAVFPLFNPETHVFKHNDLVVEMSKQSNELEWYQCLDPGTTSVFGGLFVAYNAYTGKFYIMDEIYETGADVVISRVFKKVIAKAKALRLSSNLERDWFLRCDEAAAWAMREIQDQHDVVYTPTDKNNMNKEAGISMINHLITNNLVKISDKCENLIEELLSCAKDKEGRIRKVRDHNLDCLRYVLQASNYTVELLTHKPIKRPDGSYKSYSIESFLGQSSNDLFDIGDIDWDV